MKLFGLVCDGCRTLLAFDGEEELEFVEDLLCGSYACPRCSGRIRPTLTSKGASETLRLRPSAMRRYLNGLGIDSEQADPETVTLLLLHNKVVEVGAGPSSSEGRCVLSHLRLDNGKTLHFAASGAGATIYKVTEDTDGR